VLWHSPSRGSPFQNSAGPLPNHLSTDTATKGTLIVTVTSSGTVSGANSAQVSTSTSGVVSKIFVKTATTLTPATQSRRWIWIGRQTTIRSSTCFLPRRPNQLNSAQAQMYSLQSSLFSKWKIYTDIAENSTYQNPDGSANTSNRTLTPFTTVQDDWLAAEAQYKNQQGVVAAAQTSLSSAWPIINKPLPRFMPQFQDH